MTHRSVTVVTQYFRPERGAAQVRLGSIVDELVSLRWEVRVVTSLPNYPTGRIFPGWGRRPWRVDRENGTTVVRVWVWAAMGSGVSRILNYLSFALMSVVGLVRAGVTDRYVVEYPTLFCAFPAVVWARLRRREVVLIVADLWVDSIVEMGAFRNGPATAALLSAERWLLRRCDAVTAVTEGVRDRLVDKGVDPARLVWLPNGVDTRKFAPGDGDPAVRARFGVPEIGPLVVYAGTHGYVHGLEVVLDAAERLSDKDVVFLLVGDGSEKERLVAEAEARGLRNVRFHDPVAPADVAVLLRCAVAGLATVRAGDVYRTVRSAKMFPTMATGRPVLYSGDDEGSRLVQEAGAGVVTLPGDGSALAMAIESVIEDPARCSRMGSAGREWVEQHAGWDSLVDRWLDELDRMPPGRRRTTDGRRSTDRSA